MKKDLTQLPKVNLFEKELMGISQSLDSLDGIYVVEEVLDLEEPYYSFSALDGYNKQAEDFLIFLQYRFGNRIECNIYFYFYEAEEEIIIRYCFNITDGQDIEIIEELASAIMEFSFDV